MVYIYKNIYSKPVFPLSMPHITRSVVFTDLSGAIMLKSFYAFFQVICKTVSYSVHSVFTSSADTPKVLIFSFSYWYYMMLWLYSCALFFSSMFSILLDQQPKFLFTKLSVLIVSYVSKFVTSVPTGATSLLTEQECCVTSSTEESPRSWIL